MTPVPGLIRPWGVFLCLGTGAAVAYHLVQVPAFQAVVALGLVAAATAALVTGIRAHRPEPRLPWMLLTGSQAAGIGSWVIWEHSILATGSAPSPGTIEDVFWLSSNVLLLATASFFLARRQAGIAGYLDAGILSSAFALAAWLFVFGPNIGDGVRDLGTATTLTYALVDATLLATVIRGAPRLRTVPAVLVPATVVAMLASDTAYNWLAATGAYVPGAWADLGWLLTPVLAGAAALHPDMARVFELRPGRIEARLSRALLALLVVAAFGVPAVMAVELVTGSETDSLLALLFATVLVTLVVIRLTLLIRRGERLAAALRTEDERAQYLAAIVEHSNDAIISMDVEGTIRSWNSGAVRMYGYDPDEAIGRSITILVPPDRSEDNEELVARLEAGEAIEAYETVSLAKDGRRVEISLSVSGIRDAHGVLIGFSTIARDVTERHRVEAERRRLAALVEASSDAIIGTDLDGRVVSWNAAAEAVSGWAADDVVGRNVAHVIAPERRNDLPEILERLQRGERVINFDSKLACKAGDTADVSLSVGLVRDDTGEPTGITAVARDVTAVKEAEAKRVEAEKRYRSLVEQLPFATYIDSPGGIGSATYLSPQIEEMLGYSPEEWLEDSDLFQKLLHPDDRERVVAEVHRATRAQEPVLHEYRFVARDGRIVWVRDSAVPVRDEDGRPVYRQGFVIDITETKTAEERIRVAEARYRSLVEQLPLVVYIDALDEDSSAIYMSPQIEPMLGYTVEEWLDDRELFRKVLHPDDRERVFAEVRRTQREEIPFRCEYRLVAKDGRVVWVHDEDMIVRGEDGSPLYSQGFMLDISERVEAERELARLLDLERAHNEELRELDGLKDEFVALVSHELRTPLTSIRGYLELVLDGEAGALSEEQERFLRVVDRNATRLQNLVGDLLFIAQVEAGRLAIELGRVDVAEVVAEAVEAARPSAAEKQIELHVEADELGSLAGDRGRIAQLLDNLVSNAVKFTPAGGRVMVRAASRSDRLELSVADTGIGIPEAEQPQLFQRFFRSSIATENAIPGTGLGLTIAKAIAEAHGGSIRCESAEGEGTTFTVVLPAAGAELEEAA